MRLSWVALLLLVSFPVAGAQTTTDECMLYLTDGSERTGMMCFPTGPMSSELCVTDDGLLPCVPTGNHHLDTLGLLLRKSFETYACLIGSRNLDCLLMLTG